MVSKKCLIVFGIMLFIFVLVGRASAVGVTPARTTIDFSAGLEKDVTITVSNSEGEDAYFAVYVRGELNESIAINEKEFHMAANEATKQLTFKVKLPQTLKPGLNAAEIVIIKLPGAPGTSEAFIGSAVGVAHQVYVNVPYPGKYAEASLNVINANQGEFATVVIPVVSRGNVDLVNVLADVEIYNALGTKIDSFRTKTISVASGKRGEIVHKWLANVSLGNYLAKAVLVYDGETLNLEKQFTVGSPVLELQQVDVKDFTLGQIAKFEMMVENKWSEPVSGVYTQTKVFDSKGDTMADFKSPSEDIAPLSKKAMVSYWDTEGVKAGDYEALIALRFGEKSSDKSVQMKVADNSIEIIGLGYVISQSKSGFFSDKIIIKVLLMVIGVLVLMNVLWFLVLRKRVHKPGSSDKHTVHSKTPIRV